MKKILILVTAIGLPLFASAQYADSSRIYHKYPNYIWKGDLIINTSFARINNNTVNNSSYFSRGGEMNVSYYLWNRVGIETGIAAHHFNKLSTNRQDPNQLDKKNLILFNQRLRYHIYQKPHCGTAYIQTGYSFGWFNGVEAEKVHRWEIGTLGIRTSFLRQVIPNLDTEFTFGVNKDNLSSNISAVYKIGLTYYAGNLKKQI